MFGRLLRLLFALPVALIATGAAATSLSVTTPDRPESENSFVRADKAAENPPSVEVADEDQPKFPTSDDPPTDRDVQPLTRIPPEYPAECEDGASAKEIVILEFDVSLADAVKNVEVLSSSNPCFNEVSINSVKRWSFMPAKSDGGQPRWLRGVQTTITFELS